MRVVPTIRAEGRLDNGIQQATENTEGTEKRLWQFLCALCVLCGLFKSFSVPSVLCGLFDVVLCFHLARSWRADRERLPDYSLTKFASVAPIESMVDLAFHRSLPL
jgi:hypothetical protein